MSLRRLAQTNNAAIGIGSPRLSNSTSASPRSPPAQSISPSAGPSTPRTKPSYEIHRSPASTPSISSSVPFDWDAARSRRPPPYATPPRNKSGRKSIGVATTAGTPRRVVRQKGIVQKITAIPSWIAFEIALFPHNIPLPASRTSAWLIGGTMHFLHLCVRFSQVRKVPDSDLGWEDLYRESEGDSWFDWTVPITILLICASVLNSLYLFSRIKIYRLHHQPDPVSSPHANFVSAQYDFEPLKPPSLTSRIRSALLSAFSHSWRFLLGMAAPRPALPSGKTARVQQLEVWAPGPLERELFGVYSPVHALLWTATGSSNWMLMVIIMVLIGVQMSFLIHSYEALQKDKDIIASEVMNEYNKGFVYPRLNPIRKDVAVMTHESEVVNIWE